MNFKQQLLKQNYGDKKLMKLFLKSRKHWKKYCKYQGEWEEGIREKKRC